MSPQPHASPFPLHQDAATARASLLALLEREQGYACCDYLGDDCGRSDDESVSVGGWSIDSDGSERATLHVGEDNCSCATLPPQESSRDARVEIAVRVAALRSRESERAAKVTSADRAALIDWYHAMADRCRFRRETAAVAANLMDRFAGTLEGSATLYDRTELQLAAFAALCIAVKANERTTFSVEDFSVISRGLYAPEEILDMELQMLRALSWRLCPPTALEVARDVLALMWLQDAKTEITPDTWDFLQDEAAFQIGNAVRDYCFTTRRPSTVAAAAIRNVIENLGHQEREHLVASLRHVLAAQPFESDDILLEARDRLLRLVAGDEDAGEAIMVPDERGARALEDPSNEDAGFSPGYHRYVSDDWMQDDAEQGTLSPRSILR